MIQRLDTLRRLLEAQTIICTNSYHALAAAPTRCPECDCWGQGRIPDPKWAPMLALFIPGPNRQRTSAFWEALAQGALAGAIFSAWPGVNEEAPDFEHHFWASNDPDQAAVDWAIARLGGKA